MKIFFLVSFIFIMSCRSSQPLYYSYQINASTRGTSNLKVTHTSLVSFGKYLFEFRERTNTIETIVAGDDEHNFEVYYDTIGVYLLSQESEDYFEFDTFALKNKIIKQGNILEKESGVKFTARYANAYADSKSYQGSVRDTLLNNIKAMYVRVNLSQYPSSGNYVQSLFLIENKHLNSLYKIRGENYVDPDLAIIGMHLYDVKSTDGFVEEPVILRPLTRMEINICKDMIKKANALLSNPVRADDH